MALLAQSRGTPEGVERQQFKPVAFGSGVWIVFFALGVVLQTFVRPLYVAEGTRGRD